MKTKLFTTVLLSFCLFVATPFCSQAQEPATTQNYWVIETNQVQRNYTIVRFYNTTHQLIYEERLDGIYLDATKRRTKKILNETLQRVSENALVAGQLRKAKPIIAQATAKKG